MEILLRLDGPSVTTTKRMATRLSSVDLGGFDDVAVLLEWRHGNHPGLVLGVVVGGGEDGLLLSVNIVFAISPTPVVPRLSCWRRPRRTSGWRSTGTSQSSPRRRC